MFTFPMTFFSAADTGAILLSDFDFSIPVTQEFPETAAGMATSLGDVAATPSYIWNCQETTGSLTDPISIAVSSDLAPTGNPLYGQTAVGLWDGSSYIGRSAIETPPGTGGGTFVANNSTVMDLTGSVSIAFTMAIRLSSPPPISIRFLWNRQGSGKGYWLNIDTTGRLAVVHYDGTTSKTATLLGNLADGAWHPIAVVYNETTKFFHAYSDIGTTVSTDYSANGSVSGTGFLTIGSGGTSIPGMQFAHICGYEGAAAEAIDQTALDSWWTNGNDPTGLLTTQSRASTISVLATGSYVSHFAQNKLPIGFNTNLSGGLGGYGLYCNSAITNLVVSSEVLSGSWNLFGAGAYHSKAVTDSPDGFRSADAFTSVGAGNATYSNFLMTSGSSYIYSTWIKRNQGTDVSGTVRFWDSVLSYRSEPFVATDTWQKFEVTGSAGSASGGQYIFLDSGGDSILIWGAQVNLGSTRGAYIRTSGVAASLVACNYEATFAAGSLISATKGQSEVTWVTSIPGTGNAYLYDAWVSANTDRILCYNATDGTRPTGTGYDESAVSQWVVRKAAASDMTTQENTFALQWDETGGLSVSPGGEASAIYNGSVEETDIGSYTSSNLIDKIAIGQSRADGDQPDAFIQRLRFWSEEVI